jgi:hypothetical protein
MPLLNPRLIYNPPARELKTHRRTETKMSLCGLMSLGGKSTEDDGEVDCEACLRIMKAIPPDPTLDP